MSYPFPRGAAGAALLGLACCAAQAQTQTQMATPGPARPPGTPEPTLKEVIVTTQPLSITPLPAAASSLQGAPLLLRRQSTLGETLDGLPGVSSTYFGPNASRPVIRGLDGDRIRVLHNGAGGLDASALSFDHAVAADPLSMDRVEVVRGPAALLYGGSAIGGVVNLLDNRIAREPLFDAQGGVTGLADARLGGAARERGLGGWVETGTNRFALHADVAGRHTDDTRVPASLPCTQGGVTTFARRICNSDARSQAHGLGGTLFFDQGYLGLSTSGYETNYGAVAEDEVRIDMHSRRHNLQGELRGLRGPLEAVQWQWMGSRYEHTEFDAGVAGTLFRSSAHEVRVLARQARVGALGGELDGVIGLQSDAQRFSADGVEAFAPYSRSRSLALFTLQSLRTGFGSLSLGARTESARVQSDGNPLVARFVPGRRDFKPLSLAGGVNWDVAPGWQLSGLVARSERAPRDYELFADGPHVATAAYELGNATLDTERSTSLDVGVAWRSGAHRAQVHAYSSRFSRFLLLDATGNQRGADGELNPVDADADGVADGSGEEILPEYAYRAARARFHGLEADGVVRLLERGGTLDLHWRADLVRATDAGTGQPLPRIAPMRVGATLDWARGPWGLRLGMDHLRAQNRVPAGQLVTPGATLWHAAATYQARVGRTQLLWYARLNNALDRLAYSASSVLTQTAPGKSPLPGRSLQVGLQASF